MGIVCERPAKPKASTLLSVGKDFHLFRWKLGREGGLPPSELLAILFVCVTLKAAAMYVPAIRREIAVAR